MKHVPRNYCPDLAPPPPLSAFAGCWGQGGDALVLSCLGTFYLTYPRTSIYLYFSLLLLLVTPHCRRPHPTPRAIVNTYQKQPTDLHHPFIFNLDKPSTHCLPPIEHDHSTVIPAASSGSCACCCTCRMRWPPVDGAEAICRANRCC